jgi:hypothetical protein
MMNATSLREDVKPRPYRATVPFMLPQESPQIAVRRSRDASRTDLQRLAALLACISHNNSYEGRDPQLIQESLTCGFIADLLGLKVSELAKLLAALERQGLVAAAEGGVLRLTDIRALEKLVDADLVS